MPRRPLVSVLLATHDDGRFVRQAVESILAQTFGDFEFLIYDDASHDGTTEYLMGLRDPRLLLFRNEEHLGRARSFNRGIAHARGEYIARMDATDIAEPERLARQVKHLEENLDVGIVGSSHLRIDEAGHFMGAAFATQDDLSLRWKCLLASPFAHPTAVMRKHVIDVHQFQYDESVATEHGYDLWARMMPRTRAANLTEPLLRQRTRREEGADARRIRLEAHDRIAWQAIRRIVPAFRIRLEGVTELRGRYAGRALRDAEMDPREPRWLQCYHGLLEAFQLVHRDEPGVEAFREQQLHTLVSAGLAAAG